MVRAGLVGGSKAGVCSLVGWGSDWLARCGLEESGRRARWCLSGLVFPF